MNCRAKRVEAALEEARWIHEAVEDLAHIQDKALLLSFGFYSHRLRIRGWIRLHSWWPFDTPRPHITPHRRRHWHRTPHRRRHWHGTLSEDTPTVQHPGEETTPICPLIMIMTSQPWAVQWIWVPSVALMIYRWIIWGYTPSGTSLRLWQKLKHNCTLGCKLFDTLYSKVESTPTTDSEREILQQSYQAFLAVSNTENTRIANMMNGDIVTDSEWWPWGFSWTEEAFWEDESISCKASSSNQDRSNNIKLSCWWKSGYFQERWLRLYMEYS